MATYIVHISDSGRTDCQVPVAVNEETTLARAVQTALENFEAEHGDAVEFPLFLDIYPAGEFAGVSWMHQRV